MALDHTLSSAGIREIGEALYGPAWQGPMAKSLGVPRQSIGYYLNAGGVSRTQAAAIIGLVARTAARELLNSLDQRSASDTRQAHLTTLLRRFDPA
jgi:hypothetical protein